MQSTRAIWIGAIGTALAAICCFTPALVVLLGTIGLSAVTGYLDIVLLPLLVLFVLIFAYGLIRRARA